MRISLRVDVSMRSLAEMSLLTCVSAVISRIALRKVETREPRMKTRFSPEKPISGSGYVSAVEYTWVKLWQLL